MAAEPVSGARQGTSPAVAQRRGGGERGRQRGGGSQSSFLGSVFSRLGLVPRGKRERGQEEEGEGEGAKLNIVDDVRGEEEGEDEGARLNIVDEVDSTKSSGLAGIL